MHGKQSHHRPHGRDARLADGVSDGLTPLTSLDLGKVASVDDLVRGMSSTAFAGRAIGEAADVLETMVRDAMREQALTPEAVETTIRVVELSEHPRLRGAAALVLTPAFAAPTVA